MDRFIEIFVYYGSVWLQTALENREFSLALGGLAFLLGVLLIVIVKAGKIAKLNRQIQQSKGELEQAEHKQEALLLQQKERDGQISDLQLQLELSESNLTKQNQAHKAEISNKDLVHQNTINEKNKAIDGLNAAVNTKQQQAEQLQSQLDGQLVKIARFAELESELAKAKQQEIEVSTAHQQQLAAVQQDQANLTRQLEASQQENAQLAQQLAQQKQANESLNEKLGSTEAALLAMAEQLEAAERVQQEIQSQVPMMVAEPEIEQAVEEASAPVIEAVESAPVMADSAPIEVEAVEQVEPAPAAPMPVAEKKGVMGSMTGWFSSRHEKTENVGQALQEDAVEEESEESLVSAQVSEPPHEPVVIQEEVREASGQDAASIVVEEESRPDEAVVKSAKERRGVMGGVVGWFNKVDEKLWIRKDFTQEEPLESVEPDAQAIDAPQVSVAEPEAVSTVEVASLSEASESRVEPENNVKTGQPEAGFSEKMADFADKMDAYQGKFKSLFGGKK